ncbi:MAG: toprim domain-containing protein [Deltaproteobacteria bacterium]|nr:toprim domain-containing protein [Deltaproteobacteria bacterium]
MASSKSKAKGPIDTFRQHNVYLEPAGSGHARGDCPFCGKADKFYLNTKTGQWDCKKCGESGNVKTFFEKRAIINAENLQGTIAKKLAKSRGLKVKTLRAWRVGWDGESYTIPVDFCGKTYDLRRYRIGRKMLGSTGGNVSLIGIDDPDTDVVFIAEGEWDGMALWECLQENGAHGSVVVVPGANTFPKHALPYFQKKRVFCCLDHDDGGERGSVRIQNMLKGIAKDLKFVHWPERFPDGYDVRDLYGKRGKKTIVVLKKLMQPLAPGTIHGVDGGEGELGEDSPSFDGDGLSVAEVVERYRKWLYMPNAEVLSVMFGAVLANRLDGDPIWLFLVAPPGGMKSELIMSLNDAPLIVSTTSLTPHALISGMPNQGNEDPSLIPKLDGKVLTIKDFTTILALPTIQRDEIFGILRDAYDGETKKIYGNGLERFYKSTFGIIGGVTPVIESFGASSSMLGERFLKYRIPQSGHLKADRELIDRALANIGKETKMREDLRDTAREALNVAVSTTEPPTMTRDVRLKILQLAQWVAVLRGIVRRERYTREVEFKPTQEKATRLAKQFARLGMGVAMFHGSKTVNDTAYRVVVDVARSTIPDKVEEVVKQVYLNARDDYMETSEIAKACNLPRPTVLSLLQDLELLRTLQKDPEKTRGYGGERWRLSRTLLRMMRPLGLYSQDENWLKSKASVKRKRPSKKRSE